MLSPSPFFVCCALLLFFPLSIFLSLKTTPVKVPLQLQQHSAGSGRMATESILYRGSDDADVGLLRRASLADPSPASHPKIAFLFLTTEPLPFAPLWERFFRNQSDAGRFNIYIHADPSRRYAGPFTGVFRGRVIPSKPTKRGHPSLISAARRLLARALLHDSSNSVFLLVSPSCVPLRSFPFVHRTLTNESGRSFIEILAGEPMIEARYNARGEGAMLPEVPFESFRVGSQFFALSRPHARLVVNDTALWAKFRQPCIADDACFPEEHYFSTLLSMRAAGVCVPATLTHVDWAGREDGHPRTYGREEVGAELVQKLRSARPRYGWEEGSHRRWDPFLFARKFSPECLQPLMDLADDHLFQDP